MQKSYSLNESDCILQKTAFTFDVSVWELIWWSLQGASVSLLQPGEEKNPERIISSIAENGITVIHFVPSMFAVFLEYLESSEAEIYKLKKIRQVYTSGEMLLPEQVKQFKKLLPNINLVNLYGPTEASIDVSYFLCENENPQLIPIGKPIDNTELLVLNPHTQRLVPFGSVGEICIGGVGLARGYINRESLTSERFIDNPYHSGKRLYRTGDLGRWREDGNLEFLGRTDDQVKIRGYRIELGEIEQVISTYPNSGQSIVIARALGETTDKELIVYTTGSASAEDIKLYLNGKLPHYMVPKYYVQLGEIPLTNNGKVDRKSLPDPDGTGMQISSFIAPRTETEKKLVQIWTEVLGETGQKIGVKSDFFGVGGNSIKAIRMLARVHRTWEIRLMVSDLFINSDLESLSRLINNLQGSIKSNFEIEL
jgi:acyl-CoA synthetase (AMP-forming)/AMP-acid ligase II